MKRSNAARDSVRGSKAVLPTVVVLGFESVGKSSLLSALTGCLAESSALAGTTLRCERYRDTSWDWIDTPGLVVDSDAASVCEALDALETSESVLLVLRACRAVEQLRVLLPILGMRKVAVVLTFQDQLEAIAEESQRRRLATWNRSLGTPVLLLDGRSPDPTDLASVRTAVMAAGPLILDSPDELPAFVERARRPWVGKLERMLDFAPVSLFLLFAPAGLAVSQANAVADRFHDPLQAMLDPVLSRLQPLPAPLAATLGGDYGVAAMFPFLILYALPTILIFTGLIAVYKNTGLIDRLSHGLHPWLKPFGLGGRDLVRVVMGFGCNVPAVVSTRACSCCSRGTCVSAIAFGSACSYQLPATLAVFAAAGVTWLAASYLAILAVTTLVYLRVTLPSALRSAQYTLLEPPLDHLRLPDWRAVLREIIQTLRDFSFLAFPVFIGICVLAGLLQWSGVLGMGTSLLGPVMTVFNLPPEAALPVVLGCVRKDGLAVGLLDGGWNGLKVPLEAPGQILTVVYLAGVLLPCLVTVLTIAKEMRLRFAIRMLGRQALFAVLFSLCIAWLGALGSMMRT